MWNCFFTIDVLSDLPKGIISLIKKKAEIRIITSKVKALIDEKSSYADWLSNSNVRARLEQDIKICLIKNGYPPTYSNAVFDKVMERVENFEENF